MQELNLCYETLNTGCVHFVHIFMCHYLSFDTYLAFR